MKKSKQPSNLQIRVLINQVNDLGSINNSEYTHIGIFIKNKDIKTKTPVYFNKLVKKIIKKYAVNN